MENIENVEPNPTELEPKKKPEKKAKTDGQKSDKKLPCHCPLQDGAICNWSHDTKNCCLLAEDNKNNTWFRRADADKKKSQN